ncbi:ABC transporter permease [Bacillus cereus]|uniref:ABC transporter permease n=1 Tax=Bacillus cereus HuA3-9 TaxID=1053205 RepID=R8CAY0_BACCE|nr:ABC-2 family transporter protein [Bacillus cereus]EOO08758.1 hypothetical protein IGA_06332 [Bacillus cereus HuA3-9]
MKRFLKKIKALFWRSLAEQTTYRIAIFIWMLNGLLPLFTMFVWVELSQSQPIMNRSSTDFIAYFLAVFMMGQLTASPTVGSLNRDIRFGRISSKLLLPIEPYWSYFTNKFSFTVIGFPIIMVPIIIVLISEDIKWEMQPHNIILFFLSLFGAILIQFNRQYSLGLLSFWTDKTMALSAVWESFHYVFSGSFAPISMFPEFMQSIIYYTPFPYIIGFPVEILLGNIYEEELWKGLSIQFFWVIFFIILQRIIWRKGLAKYGAVGA